jgi:hypothetical protein
MNPKEKEETEAAEGVDELEVEVEEAKGLNDFQSRIPYYFLNISRRQKSGVRIGNDGTGTEKAIGEKDLSGSRGIVSHIDYLP